MFASRLSPEHCLNALHIIKMKPGESCQEFAIRIQDNCEVAGKLVEEPDRNQWIKDRAIDVFLHHIPYRERKIIKRKNDLRELEKKLPLNIQEAVRFLIQDKAEKALYHMDKQPQGRDQIQEIKEVQPKSPEQEICRKQTQEGEFKRRRFHKGNITEETGKKWEYHEQKQRRDQQEGYQVEAQDQGKFRQRPGLIALYRARGRIAEHMHQANFGQFARMFS